MEVICESSKEWIKFNEAIGPILATVGTSQELLIGNFGLWDYQWAVSLIGKEAHLFWGYNSGNSATIEKAKQEAENFLQIVYLYEKTNLLGNAEEIIATAQQIIRDAKISAALFKRDISR